MRKLLAALLVCIVLVFAGQLYWGPTTALGLTYKYIVIDTITTDSAGGAKTITFDKDVYDLQVIPLNADTDSGYATMYFDGLKCVTHNDSVAENYYKMDIGKDNLRDTLNVYMRSQKLYYEPHKGGANDNTGLYLLKGYRP